MQAFEKKIREKWSKLSDEDIDSLRGHWDSIPLYLQRIYGYHWAEAEAAFQAFKATLDPEWDLELEGLSDPSDKKSSAGDHYADEHHRL